MKKNIFYSILLFFILCFSGVMVVKANTTCDVNTRSKLINMATNIKITYDVDLAPPITLEDEENGIIPYDYIDVKIYNLNTKLRIKAINETNNNTFNINYKNIGSDGAVTIRKVISSRVTNYKFVIYGNTDECYDVVLKTYKLTLPRQNYLSNLEMCQDIQDYYLCQPLVTYDINDDYAYNAINEYLEKRENEGKKDKASDNTSIIRKTLSNFSDNKKYISLVVVAVGIVITLLILKKRRSDR